MEVDTVGGPVALLTAPEAQEGCAHNLERFKQMHHGYQPACTRAYQCAAFAACYSRVSPYARGFPSRLRRRVECVEEFEGEEKTTLKQLKTV